MIGVESGVRNETLELKLREHSSSGEETSIEEPVSSGEGAPHSFLKECSLLSGLPRG